ncbi:MAG: hypothetical protein ABJD57_07880, partial [Roseibium sp.]|uniref:hypothetical protein n=1 Tax=Roseibium sp. TaxID=1936156 RepID=UPI00326338A8
KSRVFFFISGFCMVPLSLVWCPLNSFFETYILSEGGPPRLRSLFCLFVSWFAQGRKCTFPAYFPGCR